MQTVALVKPVFELPGG